MEQYEKNMVKAVAFHKAAIKIAYDHPEHRENILPLIKEASDKDIIKLLHVKSDREFKSQLAIVGKKLGAEFTGRYKSYYSNREVTEISAPKQYEAGYRLSDDLDIEITANKEYSKQLSHIAKVLKSASSGLYHKGSLETSLAIGFFDGGKSYKWKQLLVSGSLYHGKEGRRASEEKSLSSQLLRLASKDIELQLELAENLREATQFELRQANYYRSMRNEWAQFLREHNPNWKMVSTGEQASVGVWELAMSPNVALRIGSSLRCTDRVCDYADASIKTYLYATTPTCKKVQPAMSQDYLNGILANTQAATNFRWRQRVGTWKRQVLRSIKTAVSLYNKDKAKWEDFAMRAEQKCSGGTDVAVGTPQHLIMQGIWIGLKKIEQQQPNSDWVKNQLGFVKSVGTQLRNRYEMSVNQKKKINKLLSNPINGKQLQAAVKMHLKNQGSNYDFKGQI